MKPVKLLDKKVGDGYPCYSVAEIGGAFKNFEEAKNLIDDAIESKIDAVKFQTLEADTIVTKNIKFNFETTGEILQYDLFKEMEISKELQMEVVEYANQRGISIFSAPSHIKDLKLMEKMNLPFYKIGSDLACHIPLIKKIARYMKPIILSTGMCTIEEIQNSVDCIKNMGNEQLILLHCVSDYPLKNENANISAINSLKNKFDCPVGFSDHSIGTSVSIAAVTMGANMIERHFRNIKNSSGYDDVLSLTKDEFKNLIKNFRETELILGTGIKKPSKIEIGNLKTNRASIIVMMDVKKGQEVSENIIDVRRPGTGLEPKFFDEILGKRFLKDIKKETPLSWEMIE
jgi:N,N'-diacetyllegionaminate synthase